MDHVFSTVDETETATGRAFGRECTCGLVTIAEEPEPPHHTPLAQREAAHIAEMAAIADGSIWKTIPDRHHYELSLRRRYRNQEPSVVAISAVWMGGSQTVLIWLWTAEGLADAQAWCDDHSPVIWARTGYPVQPGTLVTHHRPR